MMVSDLLLQMLNAAKFASGTATLASLGTRTPRHVNGSSDWVVTVYFYQRVAVRLRW